MSTKTVASKDNPAGAPIAARSVVRKLARPRPTAKATAASKLIFTKSRLLAGSAFFVGMRLDVSAVEVRAV
jgi:hypothetical protein